MAKKSKIAKLEHQRATVAKYAAKRAALKEAGDYIGLSNSCLYDTSDEAGD